jgi:hypothetical protein
MWASFLRNQLEEIFTGMVKILGIDQQFPDHPCSKVSFSRMRLELQASLRDFNPWSQLFPGHSMMMRNRFFWCSHVYTENIKANTTKKLFLKYAINNK